MKIISWNCNMAFRKKFDQILQYNPDLLIVIECEQKAKLEIALTNTFYHEIIWMGANIHKGIAIITFRPYDIKLSKKYDPQFRYILPFELTVNDRLINLFVIWAMPHKKKRSLSYVGQIWGAIHHYEKALQSDSIFIGDLNSNAIWDKERKQGNHSDVVKFLNNYNIISLYHSIKDEQHGKETEPTLYMYRHEDKPYHMDYCFTSQSLISDETTIEIGNYKDWISLSDHMPIIIDLIS